jgi:Family of unknown function (DUF6252)
MKRRLKPCLYIMGIALLFNSCQNDPLPKPTQKGLDIFGCRVNGEVWIPEKTIGAIPASPAITSSFSKSGNNTFRIDLYARKNNGQSLTLFLPNAIIGDNFFSQTLPGPINYAEFYNGNRRYQTSSVNTGKITVTRADTASKILSGTFEFVGGRGNEKAIVTEGRFDVKF